MATLDEEGDYEKDAQPIPVRCPRSPQKAEDGEKWFDHDDDDKELIDCDRLVRNANNNSQHETAGEFIVSSSAVEISNSSSVHFGHQINQKTDISFERATSVVVDRRQWNYITYPTKSSIPRQMSIDNLPIIQVVQEFNRHRYRYRLAHGFTPLPWCTRFSPHLDNIYTTLQLIASDGFDGRNAQTTIALEEMLEDKQNPGDYPLLDRGRPYRVLIEGNPGYGKTTLTLKMASDWAARKEYIDKFHLVFLIPLRDFHGDLQSYIFREFFPQHEDQGRDDWWHYLKENHENILFILDGLDELQPEHRAPIDMLLKGNLFDKVSVVVTSRSLSSDNCVLNCFNRRIEVRGFSQDQTERFIQNYFLVKQKPEQGSKLTSLLNGPRWCGRHLTSCPLTCLFLCVVFEDEGDEGILHKVTQIYQGLVNWLVRRASNRRPGQPSRSDYDRALSDFGRLCLDALSKSELQFTDEQLQQLPADGGALVLELGLLIHSDCARTTTICIPKNLCYQPIHKTFLEYLAAFYLSGSVEERLTHHFDCFQALTRPRLNLTFKFLAGLLGESASVLFRSRHLSAFELPMISLFELLHESGATSENIRALSSILDDDVVIVRSNRIELDGWAGLLAEPDCPIRSLKFIWTDTPLNKVALDHFFTAFQTNRSVICMVISAASGLSPDENDVVAIGAFTVQALKKTQLRHFSLHLYGDTWTTQVIAAVNSMLNYRYAASSLTSMKINVDLGTQQVISLSQGLRQSNVKSLILSKLSCGPEGYQHIASLFKSLHHLSVSLNLIKTLPPSAVGASQCVEGSPGDLQTFEAYFNSAAQRRAGIEEKMSCSPDQSIKSNGILSFFDDHELTSFKLQDGLRLPGCVAPNALGLLTINEPVCRGAENHTSGFHSLFTALQEPDCQLVRIDLTGCCLGPRDFNCLGEALRNTRSLKSLRLAKLKSFDQVFPILINANLSWLDLSSAFISLNDESIIKLLLALSTATKLCSLSLAGWKFTIKNAKVLSIFNRFMKSSPLQELNLSGCRFRLHLPSSSAFSSISSSCLNIFNRQESGGEIQFRPKVFRRFFSSPHLKVPSTTSLPIRPSPTLSRSSSGSIPNTSSSSSDSGDVPYSHLKEKEPWPNLTKLSLTETVAVIQRADEKNEEVISGPELFGHLEWLCNLTELSVSLRPMVSGNSGTVYETMNDRATKSFFRSLQQRLGRKLEKLRMSFCSMTWHRPSQTSSAVVRRLQKCEKLVSLELNFVQFRAVHSSSAEGSCVGTPTEHDERTHWLLDAVVSGCSNLQELSLIGSTLNPTQAYNFAMQIRQHWKGLSLQIHTWRCGHDQQQTDDVVGNLLHVLKNHSKFHTDYLGGYRGTVLIRRRKHLCGLFRQIKIGIPNLLPLFNQSTVSQEHPDENSTTIGDIEQLCSTLPPGQRSLFGLSVFDYSIMIAHTWDSNKS